MKKYFYLFVAAVAALTLASCEKKDDPKNPEEENALFKIEVSDVTCTSANITVTASDSDYFYWEIIAKDSLANYAGIAEMWDEEYVISMAYYDKYAAQFEQYYGITSYEEILESFQFKGEDTYEYSELNPDCEYVVFAFKIGDEMAIVSDIVTAEFKTPAVPQISLTFAVSEDDTAFWFTPSDLEATYLAVIAPTDTLNAYGLSAQGAFDEELDYTAYMLSMYKYFGYDATWDDMLYYDAIYMPKSSLLAGQEVHFIAAGVVAGVQNSDLVDLTFSLASGAVSAPAKVAANPLAKKVAKPEMVERPVLRLRK